VDILNNAQAENAAMGAIEYLRRSYSSYSEATPELTRLKEDQYLGYFAAQYNERNAPALVWARRNAAGSGYADFSVYDEGKSHLCDIEVTALFTRPSVKKPKSYLDYSPYPPMPMPILDELPDEGVTSWDIDNPRKGFRLYATLERVVEKHLRDKYPPYWLVIYDNEHGVCHPNLGELSRLIRAILQKRAKRGRLPVNLKQVWVFDLRNCAGPTICQVHW
jgi:hypothetical protein